jgi:hypothetical protein
MPTVLKPDPFNAVLLNSPALLMTSEQSMYVREILETACSDSRFAQKAYDALVHVLGGSGVIPTLASLNPNTGVALAAVTISAHGTNFTSGSKIVVSGVEWPTTFVSPTEVTALVTLGEAGVLPVAVLNANGVLTDSVPFTVTATQLLTQQKDQQKVLQPNIQPNPTIKR